MLTKTKFFPLFLRNAHFFYLNSLSLSARLKKLITTLDFECLIRSERTEFCLSQIQEKRLTAILRHAIKNVPYWKERKTRDLKLESFPIVGKQDIKKDLKKFISANAAPSQYFEDLTSGTSGIPFLFLSDRRFLLRRSVMHKRGNSWTGFAEIDKTLRVLYKDIPGLAGLGTFYKFSNPETVAKDKDYLYGLLSSGDFVLYATTFFLISLAELAEKDKKIIPMKAAISMGERLSPYYQKLCEKTFLCQVFDNYSMREFGRVAQECKEHNGLHINSEMFLIEIVDADGNKLKDNEEGRVVITSFDNYVMPFIRYDTGDAGKIVQEKCACGKILPRLFLNGRTTDNIQLSDGSKVQPRKLYKFFNRRFQEIKQFQIVQRSLNDIIINVSPTEKFKNETIKEIREEIEAELGRDLRITVNTTDTFALSPGGKTPVFVSEIKKPAENNI